MTPMPGPPGGGQPPQGPGWQAAGRGGGQAGWRRDPAGRFEERFLAGGRWTRRVRWGGAEAVDLQAVDEEGPPPTDWQQRPDGVSPQDLGWMQDPTGRFPERWWDGQGYTRKVRVGQAVATDTEGAPQAQQRGGTSTGAGTPGPGWRDDPQGHGQRYWDGHEWTAKWRAGPTSGGGGGLSLGGLPSPTMLLALAVAAVLLLVVGVIVVIVVLLV